MYNPAGTSRAVEAHLAEFEKNLEYYRVKDAHKLPPDAHPAMLPKHALVKALNRTFFREFWGSAVAKIASDVGSTLLPLLTRHLITFTAYRTKEYKATHPDVPSMGRGIGFALGIAFLMLFNNFMVNIFFYGATMTGAQVRTTLIAAIFKKNLRLSPKARLMYPNGIITNLMSIDTHRIDFNCNWFHFSWTFPVSVGISIAIVVTNIGASGMVGFAVFLVTFFLIVLTGKHLAHLRGKTNKATDGRVSAMREILQAIKIIKFYSWEDAYEEKVAKMRSREMTLVIKMLAWRNVINSFIVSVPVFAGLFSFIVLSRTGGSLNPATVFSSLSVFNVMRLPLVLLPLSIITTIDAMQSLTRIEGLLSAPEIENYLETSPDIGETAIRISNGTFIWQTLDENDKPAKKLSRKERRAAKKLEKEQKKLAEDSFVHGQSSEATTDRDAETLSIKSLTKLSSDDDDEKDLDTPVEATHKLFKGLNNINLDVPRGTFLVVTGTIGTGKSSLLSAMSGTMHLVEGSVQVSGSLVAAGQPWVQNSTVRDNIVFGHDFDPEWYAAVVDACALERDFEILPAGDETEVGERGITLSGGQKARINLARAVYANPDTILLDDVLSAVDAHVGKYIMEKCILGLMRSKTRVLATHQLALIEKYADKVLFLDGSGGIVMGSVEELRKTVPAFDELMAFNDHAEVEEEEPIEIYGEPDGEGLTRRVTTRSSLRRSSTHASEKVEEDPEKVPKATGALMQTEEREVDSISWDVYRDFVRFGSFGMGWFLIPVFLSILILANFSTVFNSVWLAYWTSDKFARSEGFYIGIFVMIAVMSALLNFGFFLTLTAVGNRTAKKLNLVALHSMLHAPMSFFDSTPLGRILNRFTHDSNTMDVELSDQVRLFLFSTSSSIATVIMVACYLPWILIAAFGLGAIFVLLASFYRASARDIKRIDAVVRSRVFAHFGESLSGAATIIAYGAQARFTEYLEHHIDAMNGANYATLANQRWLAVRLDIIAFSMTLITTLLCVTGVFDISPSDVGVVVSGMLSIMPMISLIIREMATTENSMNSVERIHHYAYNVEQEGQFHSPAERKPAPSWPESGRLTFNNVVMSYRPELEPALKNFSADVAAAEKIGICGRTGAGKSTIMTALYRLVELRGGSIVLDGVDIRQIGLHDLRSKLAIIPQDPVLFQGTVRSNIDPFGEYDDARLWDALRRAWLVDPVELAKVQELEARGVSTGELVKAEEEVAKQISSGKKKSSAVAAPGTVAMPKFHLDRSVDDDGTNFSLGERQLLTLATALVRNARVLILDEATSNVDFQTDSKIQATIKSEFKDCTILCIAHRLKTILNYDRILVMDLGEIAEFDTPRALYTKQDGIFRSMCQNSGITLEDIAQAERGGDDL